LTISTKRWAYAVWLVLIAGFAVLHALHLRADFPNHTIWHMDYAKYTDEGWYGNGAVRAHLFGNWYVPGDFNPATAVPVWQLMEWLLFFLTGVTIEAARGLAVGFFFVNLLLSYMLLRTRGPRWMALLALTLIVTSPFLYCFSRLAILEPSLTALTLGALNVAVRLPRLRRPLAAAAGIGVLFTLMMLDKTTAIFLLPALVWAVVLPLWQQKKLAMQGLAAAGAGFAVTFGGWMALIAARGMMVDYRYYFFVNRYVKPPEYYWPLISLWWSFHGVLWVDQVLIPLGLAAVLGGAVCWRSAWGRGLLLDPVVGASLWAIAGYIFFMTYQNHPQPRYYAVVAFFGFFLVAQGAQSLLALPGGSSVRVARLVGWGMVAVAAAATAVNGSVVVGYAAHPEYTWVDAAQKLTTYIDHHPNGKRLMVSISGDDITMMTHLPTLCDDFGTMDLAPKIALYNPGWYAAWNDLDPGTLEDLHNHYSLEQAASFRAMDDEERNVLILFKLHPLPNGESRDPTEQDLKVELPDDKFDANIQ